MAEQTVTTTHPFQELIERAFDRRTELSPSTTDRPLLAALNHVVEDLNAGRLRVAEKIDGTWTTH